MLDIVYLEATLSKAKDNKSDGIRKMAARNYFSKKMRKPAKNNRI